MLADREWSDEPEPERGMLDREEVDVDAIRERQARLAGGLAKRTGRGALEGVSTCEGNKSRPSWSSPPRTPTTLTPLHRSHFCLPCG